MKRILALLFVLGLPAGFAAAQGIGLTAGLEFGLENVTKANDGEMGPYLTPMVIYENSFLDSALDLYAELDYTFGFSKVPDGTGEVFPQSLYFDFSVGYNLKLGDASTLSFILENENDSLLLSPRDDAGNNIDGVLKPGVKFNQNLSFGDLYAQVDVPVHYIENTKDADIGLGLDFILGWQSTFGLGIEVKEHNTFKPETDYIGLDVIVSYEKGPIYAEIEVDTPGDMDENGISVIPEFDYSLKAFTFYVNCAIDNIGSDADTALSPALGIKYSF